MALHVQINTYLQGRKWQNSHALFYKSYILHFPFFLMALRGAHLLQITNGEAITSLPSQLKGGIQVFQMQFKLPFTLSNQYETSLMFDSPLEVFFTLPKKDKANGNPYHPNGSEDSGSLHPSLALSHPVPTPYTNKNSQYIKSISWENCVIP